MLAEGFRWHCGNVHASIDIEILNCCSLGICRLGPVLSAVAKAEDHIHRLISSQPLLLLLRPSSQPLPSVNLPHVPPAQLPRPIQPRPCQERRQSGASCTPAGWASSCAIASSRMSACTFAFLLQSQRPEPPRGLVPPSAFDSLAYAGTKLGALVGDMGLNRPGRGLKRGLSAVEWEVRSKRPLFFSLSLSLLFVARKNAVFRYLCCVVAARGACRFVAGTVGVVVAAQGPWEGIRRDQCPAGTAAVLSGQ